VTALVDEQALRAPEEGPTLPSLRPRPISEIRRHLRASRTLWCPGCSNGIVTRAIVDAVSNLALDTDKVAVFAGIGCCGRITTYIDYSTVHTTHGRALAFASGAKVADPTLHVIVVMGDGDCAAIGGNHLIHAARRNIDVTAVVFNNSIYGMTGGQMSPTTHVGDRSTTSTYGNVERAFDLCELAHASGATYVARGTAWDYRQLAQLIAGGLHHHGFAFVEAMAVCPVYYGRQNLTADPAAFLTLQKEHAVPASDYGEGVARRHEVYPVGVLHHAECQEYTDGMRVVRGRAMEGRRE
jgi:2-oxoglutarate ferredoxin oxidoreductase subunit beta